MFRAAILTASNELSALQQRTAFRRLGYRAGVPAPDTEIPADHCLQLWVIMLIWRLKYLSSEQRDLLIDEMLPALVGLGSQMIDGKDVGTPVLCIGDGRYAAWHGKTGFLDLQTGVTVTDTPRDIIESTAYNLAVLFARNLMACRRLQERAYVQPPGVED